MWETPPPWYTRAAGRSRDLIDPVISSQFPLVHCTRPSPTPLCLAAVCSGRRPRIDRRARGISAVPSPRQQLARARCDCLPERGVAQTNESSLTIVGEIYRRNSQLLCLRLRYAMASSDPRLCHWRKHEHKPPSSPLLRISSTRSQRRETEISTFDLIGTCRHKRPRATLTPEEKASQGARRTAGSFSWLVLQRAPNVRRPGGNACEHQGRPGRAASGAKGSCSHVAMIPPATSTWPQNRMMRT